MITHKPEAGVVCMPEKQQLLQGEGRAMPGLAGPAVPQRAAAGRRTGCLLSLGLENAAAAFPAAALGESCPKPSRERWEGCRNGVWVCRVRGFPGRWDSPPRQKRAVTLALFPPLFGFPAVCGWGKLCHVFRCADVQ